MRTGEAGPIPAAGAPAPAVVAEGRTPVVSSRGHTLRTPTPCEIGKYNRQGRE